MREDWKVSCWMLGDVKDLIKVWNCEAIFPKLFLNFYQEALWSKQQWICIIGNEEVIPNQNALEFFQMEGGFSSSCFARFHLEALNKCLLRRLPHPPPRPAQDGIRRRLQLLKDLAKLPLKLLFLLLTTIKYKYKYKYQRKQKYKLTNCC